MFVSDPVQHAKNYPFAIPDHSFLFEGGTARRLGNDPVDRTARVPVLAAGSNQSPEQLARKYSAFGGTTIVADRGTLRDFDVVYAAHLSSYGSVPATFQGSAGTSVTVFVLWLDEHQLARMHETEGNYTYDQLGDIFVTLDNGDVLSEAFAYSARVGCLNVGGEPIGLSEIPATGRQFRALSQPEIQSRMRDRLSPNENLDEFIRSHLEDVSVRQARSNEIAKDALALEFDRTIILSL